MIEQLWQSYLNEVILAGAKEPVGKTQISESRKCFYAGIASMFHLVSGLSDLSEDVASNILSDISRELRQYVNKLKQEVNEQCN